MIKANHNWKGKFILAPYIRRILKKNFKQIVISSNLKLIDDSKSILLLCNHISWWDGFFAHHLAENHFQKLIHVLMLEEEIKKNPILSHRGAFGFNSTGKDIVAVLDYTKELLKNENNLVSVYPQGKIESQLKLSPNLPNGMFKLAHDVHEYSSLIQATFFTDYLNHRKPSLFIYLDDLEANSFKELKEKFMENYINNHLTQQSLNI